MSVDIQIILAKLAEDMNSSEGLKPSTKQKLQPLPDYILGSQNTAKILQDNAEICWYTTPWRVGTNVAQIVDNQEKVATILIELLEAVGIEDPLDYTGVRKICRDLQNKKSSEGVSMPPRFRLMQALAADEQFKADFIGLFTKSISEENGLEHTVFPSISNNPDKMQALQNLIHFCSANQNDIEPDHPEVDVDATSQTTCLSPISTMVLGGFITALGIAAVALLLTVPFTIPPIAFGIAAIAGIGVIGAGIGTFAYGFFNHCTSNASQTLEMDQPRLQ